MKDQDTYRLITLNDEMGEQKKSWANLQTFLLIHYDGITITMAYT